MLYQNFNRLVLYGLLALLIVACHGPQKTTAPSKPGTVKPGNKPTPSTGTPPANPSTGQPNNGAPTNPPTTGQPTTPPAKRETYRVAVLLPFLTNQFDAASGNVPEKSKMALQYYAGIQIALTEISKKTGYPNLVVDVLDTQVSDADFQIVMNDRRVQQAQVIIGPVRPSHVSMMAEKTRSSKQILISPEVSNPDLTTQNNGFIQINPSLRAHCSAIVQHLRSVERMSPDQIVLVCKEKEADRLAYFQDANAVMGGTPLKEIKVPDAATNFDKIDLKAQIKTGRSTAFILPTWASQDYVLAFLAKLKAVKGSNTVSVYGMPQWAGYEGIEPDLLTALNVHITAAGYTNYKNDDARAFQHKFYELYGTIPDQDAVNGYDIMHFAANQLYKYGLSFPEKMSSSPTLHDGLQGGFYFRQVRPQRGTDTNTIVSYDYIENILVQILTFNKYGFVPAE